MSEFKFHPGKTYELLLKQANAMQLIIRSLEKRRHVQNVNMAEMARELALQGFEEINAQRDINEKLTNEVMALESERDALKAELEAARKQEPAVLIEGKKIFWNPEYKGVHEGGFYASPVPAQPSRDLLRAIVDATWGHAYESEQVPSTDTADKIINAVLSKFTAAANHEGTNHGNG